MKKALLFLAVTINSMAWNNAKVIEPPVFNGVHADMDGDTLWMKKENGKPFKVRLIGLDTFETKVNHRVWQQLITLKNIHPHQKHSVKEVLKWGHKARDFTKSKTLNKVVQYYSYGKDKYGRELVYIKNLNYLLIRNGLAVQYPTNLIHKDRKSFLLDASREANREKRGFYQKDSKWHF